jgi:hypothetical protein
MLGARVMSARNAAVLAAGAAVGFGGRPEPKRMRLIGFKAVEGGGALRGFASIELPSGLQVQDCPILVGQNGPWAALPSKPVLDRDGRHVETNGKRQYAALLKWRDRDLTNRWSAAVIELVRAAHPEALAADRLLAAGGDQ